MIPKYREFVETINAMLGMIKSSDVSLVKHS